MKSRTTWGRPSKLTPALAGRIARAIADGATTKAAAESVEIDEATLYRWLARGERGEPGFRTLRARVMAAREEAAARKLEEFLAAKERRKREVEERRAARVLAARMSAESSEEFVPRPRPPRPYVAEEREQWERERALGLTSWWY